MIWSSQTETDSWIENTGNGLMGLQIVKNNGQLKFVVNILPGLPFSIVGKFVQVPHLPCPKQILMNKNSRNFHNPILLQFKYSDEKIRISRGYSNILLDRWVR